MQLARKLAISLPEELVTELDAAASSRHETRSGFIRMALLAYFESQRKQEAVKAYVDGYSREPEREDEIALAEATSTPLLASEVWE